ncbi:MAG: polysaccharide ABC transporter ATP-binding protein [Dysgonomonas sp.]
MSNIAIKFENISKQYRLGTIGTGTLQHDLNRWWHTMRGKEDPYLKIGEVNDRSKKSTNNYVWALKDISFDVEQGEVLGIIGKNGAGKSTLLKLLSRVTSPTTGQIMAKGRIASLLEVGTGFHPEMTGRQNVYMNGAIMGMTKQEIKRKLDEIIDFAGVEKYIDTPVKRYSSGMTVRLGFAVAAHLEPEILVVDEVLAVGDAEFQKKAIGKMKDVSQGGGRTVLFVSHQLNSISTLCGRCALMKDGGIDTIGETESVISKYLSLDDNPIMAQWVDDKGLYQNEFCTLKSMAIVDRDDSVIQGGIIRNDQECYVKMNVDISSYHTALCVGIAVYTMKNQLLFWSYNTDEEESKRLKLDKGQHTLYIKFPKRMLNEGQYLIKPIISLHFISWIINPDQDGVPALTLTVNGGLSDSLIWNDKRPGLLAPVIEYKDSII